MFSNKHTIMLHDGVNLLFGKVYTVILFVKIIQKYTVESSSHSVVFIYQSMD